MPTITAQTKTFSGFRTLQSNFFLMPNEWTDITSDIDNIAELKVVEYIMRHTWGFEGQGESKKITLDEFVQGRKRRDGTRLDKGTKLCQKSVQNGLKKAIEHGYVEEEIDGTDKARIKKYYLLKMSSDSSPDDLRLTWYASVIITAAFYWLRDSESQLAEDAFLPTPQDVGVVKFTTQDTEWQSLPIEIVNFTNRTEKETSEKNLISNSNTEVREEGELRQGRTGAGRIAALLKDYSKVSVRGREVLEQAKPGEVEKVPGHKNTPPQTVSTVFKLSLHGRALVQEISRDLGDWKSRYANIKQVENLMREYHISEAGMRQILFSAKGLTREVETTNPAAYFFTIVREKVSGKKAG